MLQWQHLFSSSVLQRGREYYKKNKVRSLIQDGEHYYASVEGTEEYEVQVRVQGDQVTEMSCDCPYAQEGNRCKHMAATLYEIVAREIPGLRSNWKTFRARTGHVLITPFDDAGQTGAYRYYMPERFTRNLEIYADTYDKARKLIADQELRDVEIRNCFTDEHGTSGKAVIARGYLKKNAYYPVRVVIARDRVTSMSCPVYGCKGYYGNTFVREKTEICEHCLALLILAIEEMGRRPHWDGTDEQARRLIENYWGRVRMSAVSGPEEDGTPEPGRPVRLEPRLEDTGDKLELNFRIGTGDKLYVLKTPEALVEAVQAGAEFPLGSRSSLHFSSDYFGERDRKWYDLIRQAVLEKRHHEDLSYGRTKKLQGITLYGALLDDFFDLARGHSIELRTETGAKRRLEVSDETPRVELELVKDSTEDGTFHGMILRGELPRVFDGVHARYCMESGRLCRIEGDSLRTLDPLIASAKGDSLEMHIGRSFLTDFYHHIVPELAKSVDLIEPDRDEVLQYLPPEVSFRFFLDVEDGTPICRPVADYGDRASFPLMDWRRETHDYTDYRDQMQESAVLLRVEEFFPLEHDAESLAAWPDEDSVYRVLTEGVDTLCRLGEVMSTSAFDALTVRRSLRIQVGVSVESELMDLKISSEDVTLAELAEILNSYKLKKKYHRLKNGDFIRMDESIGELVALTDTLRLSRKELLSGDVSVPAYRALYLAQMLENTREIYTTRDRHYRQLIKDFNTVKDSDYEVPEELRQVLRGYQVYGYKWLRTLAGCGFSGVLADEMGLGKTLQIISVLLAEKLDGSIGTSLVVCPASLVYNWVEEFRRFAPTVTVCPVEGGQAERREIIEHCGRWDVLISSYDHLKRDIAAYEGKLFFCEVLDEAQFIKNQSTASARAVKVIHAKHRFALTGTPIENRLSELWSIFDFLMPGFLYGYETFRSEMEKPIARDGDEAASLRLKRMVSPFILRRLKTEVLKDLPEKVEEAHVVRFGDEQQKLYDAQVLRMKNLLEEESDESFRKSKIQILAELTRIRQICCDPALLFENYSGGSAKMEACMDLVHSAIEGEHRILLFSQFTSMLDLLKERLDREEIPYYEITGATPKKERLRLVTDFNTGDVPLFLISLRAGGTGLNLTGADIVIHYDPWWNAAAQNQATDRAHRIGQQKPVTVFKLIAKDSIEEKIQQLQEKKLNLADEIIGGEQVSFSSLTREDLLTMIQ